MTYYSNYSSYKNRWGQPQSRSTNSQMQSSNFNMNSSIQDSSLSIQYLNLLDQPPFIIKINDKQYKCNPLGVNSSKVIQEYRIKNPDSNQYEYNLENTNNEFQIICDIFNFKQVQLTTKNMNSLLHICEDLQIEAFLQKITAFSDLYESIIQESENIDELFTWLYQIQALTVESVKNSILNSIWIENFENIKEFVSIFLQVVRTTSYQNQLFLVDLLISLDQLSDEVSQLKNMMPFFISKMKTSFFKSNLYCSFIFKMSKKGLISLDEIIDLICEFDTIFSNSPKKNSDLPFEQFETSHHKNVVMWFFPELYEMKNFSVDKILRNLSDDDTSIIQKYLPEKIAQFKKMRDLGEPDNDLHRSIYFDDVDSMQKIITNSRIDINSTKTIDNFFNVFDRSIRKSYINYAAECGSLKCFKFLLLNHAEIDKMTYGFAVYGGNTEIVRIVDQQNEINKSKQKKEEKKSPNRNYSYGRSSSNGNKENDESLLSSFDMNCLTDPINLTIIMHKYDLFDWIFEKQISSNITNDKLNELAKISVQNGNLHSLTQLIDNGLVLSKYQNLTNELVKISSILGFYRFTKLLCSFVEKISLQNSVPLIYGSLSIFKLFYNKERPISNVNFDILLSHAIKRNYIDIVHYIIEENLFTPEENKPSSFKFIETAVSLKDASIFNYFEKKFSLDDLKNKFKYSRSQFSDLLKEGCVSGNIEAVEKITDFIIKNYPNEQFSKQFVVAGSSGHEEICQYFIDKKVSLNVSVILQNYKILASKIGKIILGFLNSVDKKTKEAFSNFFLNEAIIKGNVNLVETLLNKETLDNQALFNAVRSHNIEIVNKILQCNSKPSFINQMSQEGTALNIAVYNNDLPIVNTLLSLKEINPSLRSVNGMTPLIVAISNFNLRIFNSIVDFYGDKIKDESWQIKKAFKIIFKRSSNYSNIFKKMYPIIDRLASIKEIDLNFYIKNQTLLILACQISDAKLVEILLKSEKIDVNLYDLKSSETPLITSIIKGNSTIANMLIEHPSIDINYKNNEFQTALIMAVKKKYDKIIPCILNHPKFDPYESNLDYAFYISDEPIMEILYESKDLNVNYKFCQNKKSDYVFETCLKHAIIRSNIKKIELILSHPSFDPAESFAKESIFNKVFALNYQLLKKLLKVTNSDINMCSSDGKSLFAYCTEKGNDATLKNFLNDEEFKPTKNDFISAFVSLFNHSKITTSIELMNEMVKFDEVHNNHFINFDELLSNGKSFYTSIYANLSNVSDVVKFFIDHNVDPNKSDSTGTYPLEFALISGSIPFVVALLDSQKVDFSVKLNNNETYIHLAETNPDEEIAKEFINRKLIDPNSQEYQNLRLSVNQSYLKKNSTASDMVDEIVVMTEGTEYPITRQLIINNIDLYEKVFSFFNLDENHSRIFDFAETFFKMVMERKIGDDDHFRHNDDLLVGRSAINAELIHEIIMITEDTEFPITKQMIINHLDLFINIIRNYNMDNDNEEYNKFQQILEFSQEFYNCVMSNNDDD